MTSAFGDQASPMMTSANNVGEGWHKLLRDLEGLLNILDPDYELQQVKEKFGGLRYYAQTQKTDVDKSFHWAIHAAEGLSVHICEECGEPGKTHSIYGWLHTLCDTHETERRKNHAKTMREMDRNHGGEG